MLDKIRQAAVFDLVRPIDLAFARFMSAQGGAGDAVVLGACLVSQQSGEGHVCVDLTAVAGRPLFGTEQHDACPTIVASGFQAWETDLRGSDLVGRPGDTAPLILDEGGRLYLAKYWQYESRLAAALRARALGEVGNTDPDRLRASLDRYFPEAKAGDVDWQKVAAAVAALKPLAVISGGPGTGKTTTVTRILALLLEQAPERPLRIALAAPTGKAAARLSQSIRHAKEKGEKALTGDNPVRDRIPEQAVTLHRLLRLGAGRARPYYHADNPLPLDLLVLDEASMIDLPLMAKLVNALPPRSRLILLGDRDQLFSVEAGKVLGDLCDAGASHGYSEDFLRLLQQVTGFHLGLPEESVSHPVGDCIAILKKSHRFDSGSGIGALANAVNLGKGEASLHILHSEDYPEVSWQTGRGPGLTARLATFALQGYRDYLNAGTPEDALQCFEQYRLLCATRGGPFGVDRLNRLVEDALREQGLIRTGEPWYPGRPIMITRNDYTLHLFNGDVGLILPDPESGRHLRAFFIHPEAGSADSRRGPRLKKILPSRLPTHETVYAMTVHKSQGSEFQHIDLLLPDEPSPVLTRELVYTGITRARKQVRLWGKEEILLGAIATRVERASGLREALWA
jgi:exodeoxyribonuclease V alpha subunit